MFGKKINEKSWNIKTYFGNIYFLPCSIFFENVTLEEHKIKLLLNVTQLKKKQQQQKNVTQSS